MVDISYNIKGKYINFKINKNIYPLNIVMKTAYIFTGDFYLFFDYFNEDYLEVRLSAKLNMPHSELVNKTGEFNNELLNQSLRFDIQEKTKNLRQLILGRALYSECIEYDENAQNDMFEYDSANEPDEMDSDGEYESDKYGIASMWDYTKQFGDRD